MYCPAGKHRKVVRLKQMIDRSENFRSLLGRFLTTIDRVTSAPLGGCRVSILSALFAINIVKFQGVSLFPFPWSTNSSISTN